MVSTRTIDAVPTDKAFSKLPLGSEVGQTAFSSKRSDDLNQIIREGEVAVQMTRLDVVLNDSDRDIARLKIDVEGYEKFVTEGLRALLRRTRVILFESYEMHYERFGYSLDEIVSLLTKEGFVIGKINRQSHLFPLPPGYRSNICENLVALNRSMVSECTQ